MEFRCLAVTGALKQAWAGDTLVVGLFAPATGSGPGLAEELVGEGFEALLQRRRFEGKSGQTITLERPGGSPASLILVGLGEPADFGLDALLQASAGAARSAAAAGAVELGLWLPVEGLEPAAAAAAMAEAVRLGLFADQRFKSEA